jgi:integrase
LNHFTTQLVLPFTDEEVERLLAAARGFVQFGNYGPKMEPMLLLLRYSGLRIYFFYDGKSQPESMVKSWDRVFQKIGASADPTVADCHPHRFRDTFAVSPLLKGVSLESVSKLLGHSSIKITERHYAPWVKARQEQLEAEVRRIWNPTDPARDSRL